MKAIEQIFAATLVSLTAIVLTANAGETAPAGKQPNIIFLMDDQHRWDALGRLDPAVKTPTLDRLAKDGVLCDQNQNDNLC